MTSSETGETPTRARARGRPAVDWQKRFLAAYADCWTITAACKAAGVSRATVDRERQRNEDFAVDLADAEQSVSDRLMAEGYRRALDGSDQLLMFFLRARRPDVYRDQVKVEHAGNVQTSFNMPGVPRAVREQIAKLLEEADAE